MAKNDRVIGLTIAAVLFACACAAIVQFCLVRRREGARFSATRYIVGDLSLPLAAVAGGLQALVTGGIIHPRLVWELVLRFACTVAVGIAATVGVTCGFWGRNLRTARRPPEAP